MFCEGDEEKKRRREKMQLVHPRPKVNYRRVIDALADSIRELNRTNRAAHDIEDRARVAPAAPPVIAVPSDFDVDAFVEELLRTLDQRAAESGTGSVGDEAAHAAAEHSASSQEFVALPAFLGFLSAASTIAGFALTTYELIQIYQRSQRGRRR
jgi:hypothetical protein